MLTFVVILLVSAAAAVNGDVFPDWLVTPFSGRTRILRLPGSGFRLTNGLISRDFMSDPGFATIEYYSHERKQSLLRAISPEAVVLIDDTFYNIGGLLTSIPRAYLNRTALAKDMSVDPNAFQYVDVSSTTPDAPFQYTPSRHAPDNIVWPPAGIRMDMHFRAPATAPPNHQQIKVTVHWEMYDGIPLMTKRVSISGPPELSDKVRVFVVSVEYLAVNWQWAEQGYGWMHVENDVPHTNVNWELDNPGVRLPGAFQLLPHSTAHHLHTYPDINPDINPVLLKDGFESFRVHELVVGSSDPERMGLAIRRKMRLLAPQTQENPITFHTVTTQDYPLIQIVGFMQRVGFEMLVFSFGTDFNVEADDPDEIKWAATIVKRAINHGLEVGAYDLIAWTKSVQDVWKAAHDDGACMASGWYDYLLDHILNFMEKANVTMFETDGPYHGYRCYSTNHSHHTGPGDSVYQQLKLQSQFYRTLRERGVYISHPDNYIYQGANKIAFNYDAFQFSLPRWVDLSISRQQIFDDTFRRIPTSGSIPVPISDYSGGGPEATFVPLWPNEVEYNWALAQYFGAGVTASFRGNQITDTSGMTYDIKAWVDFYKKYRDILTSDIIHVRRADMQGIDALLHVNPSLQIKGLLFVFNPIDQRFADTLTVPLYYTGLTDRTVVSERGQKTSAYNIDRNYNVELYVDIQPLSVTWFLFQ